MAEDSERPAEVVVLFDECVPRMEECGPYCQEKNEILCKHRINADAAVLYASQLMAQHRDLFLVTHLFNLVIKNKVNFPISFGVKMIIVTSDKKFFKSARRQYETKKRVIKLTFNQENKTICLGSFTVYICIIKCGHDARNRASLLRCAITNLNNYLIK